MKTHQEIREAIEQLKRDVYGGADSASLRILHALNDRIERHVIAADKRIAALEDSHKMLAHLQECQAQSIIRICNRTGVEL